MRPAPKTPTLAREPTRGEARWALALFLAGLAFHLWGMTVGWESKNMPGVEYRQAQTAISALFIKQERNFSLEYPTPVLGKPWSIPMEFPLYQWAVAALSRQSGLGITMSGRLVGIACFYLSLPALFLLLARWRVAPARRWLVLAVVVTCPFYIFYARAVLMETMALMLALWFWVGFERGVAERSRSWLAVAVLAGTGAGLVKVTTFILFLLPAGIWAALRLWRQRAAGRWMTEIRWMATAVALPFACTFAWVRYADGVKARNPLAWFLDSGHLQSFTWGTLEARVSPALWKMTWRIFSEELSGVLAWSSCVAVVVLAGRGRWREILACVGCFAAALLIFPVLYANHDYYFMANTVFLLLAMGLALVALAESPVSRGLLAAIALMVCGTQAYRYVVHYYPGQRGVSLGGDGLSALLRDLTRPDEYVIITGQDWNSMTPYYAQRRALMLRSDYAGIMGQVDKAWANMAGEKLGALVLDLPPENYQWLVDRAAARGLETQPLLTWRNYYIFLPAERLDQNLRSFEEKGWDEAKPLRMRTDWTRPMSNKWVEVAGGPPQLRRMLHRLQPMPTRIFSTFGPAANESGTSYHFGVHPVTRLVFALPAGRYRLNTTFLFPLETYAAELPASDCTDGVDVRLEVVDAEGRRTPLFSRLLDPRANSMDRGEQPIGIDFVLGQPGEVELSFGPGPQGRDTRDWLSIGPLTIVPR